MKGAEIKKYFEKTVINFLKIGDSSILNSWSEDEIDALKAEIEYFYDEGNINEKLKIDRMYEIHNILYDFSEKLRYCANEIASRPDETRFSDEILETLILKPDYFLEDWYGDNSISISSNSLTHVMRYIGRFTLAKQNEISLYKRYGKYSSQNNERTFHNPQDDLIKSKESSVDTHVALISDKSITGDLRNKFNGILLESIKIYFGQLATEKSANGNPYLDKRDVEQFIDRAFLCKSSIPRLTMNIHPNSERGVITKLFYNFYDSSVNYGAEHSHRGTKEKYVKLLTDHFTNFRYDAVSVNFNKSKYANKDWAKLTI